jgi:hypothetical protein
MYETTQNIRLLFRNQQQQTQRRKPPTTNPAKKNHQQNDQKQKSLIARKTSFLWVFRIIQMIGVVCRF